MTIFSFIRIRINERRQTNPSTSWFIYLFILNKLIIIIIIIVGIIRIRLIHGFHEGISLAIWVFHLSYPYTVKSIRRQD